MTINTIQNICGNGYCQIGESFSNCAADCAPSIKDIGLCVINNSECKIPWYTNEMATFVFFVGLALLLVYLKKKRVI